MILPLSVFAGENKMLSRRFTGNKEICLLRPALRFKQGDMFKCEYNFDGVRKEYRYYVFIPSTEKSNVLEKWEITQNTYYKLVNNSTEC